MNLHKNFLIFLSLSLAVAGCSVHRAHVKYTSFKDEMPIKTASWNGDDLGSVEGEDGGAIWDDCSRKAKGSLRELISNAQALGANAIGNIRWDASNSSQPTCKKGWGYLLIPVFILTPLFMSTRVRGVAFKVNPKKALLPGFYLIPDSPDKQDKLVNHIWALHAQR